MLATSPRSGAQSKRPRRPSRSPVGTCEIFAFDEDRVARARATMLPTNLLHDVAATFKLLAHPTRVQILRALAHEELCVCDLAQIVGLSVSATSHQLHLMRNLRLVRYRMEGKLAYYRVVDSWAEVALAGALRRIEGSQQ